jgi:hypothetical protein
VLRQLPDVRTLAQELVAGIGNPHVTPSHTS